MVSGLPLEQEVRSLIDPYQQRLVTLTAWPMWALVTVEVLVALNLVAGAVDMWCAHTLSTVDSNTNNTCSSKDSKEKKEASSAHLKSFRSFQLKYLSVYFIIMLADWLQGTNMYTLYSSYGVDVGTLFLTGFLSSAVFGTFLGIVVDSWGRKLGCVVFCLLEVRRLTFWDSLDCKL
jgi:hypothetical protein